VRDHGAGVEAAFVDRLFEKFSRSGARMDVPGTGLGLSIVRGLAEANGGLAWYEGSRHGAVFALRLPATL
jgi:signal transduction histidine kinase